MLGKLLFVPSVRNEQTSPGFSITRQSVQATDYLRIHSRTRCLVLAGPTAPEPVSTSSKLMKADEWGEFLYQGEEGSSVRTRRTRSWQPDTRSGFSTTGPLRSTARRGSRLSISIRKPSC